MGVTIRIEVQLEDLQNFNPTDSAMNDFNNVILSIFTSL